MERDNFYELYLEELKTVTPCTEEETKDLLLQLQNGDKTAEARLVEGHLNRVGSLIKEFEGKGVSVADLVQEGNMALVIAVSEFELGEFYTYVDNKIKDACNHVINNLELEKNAEEEILAKVNVLKKISSMLAEELGREADVRELAQRMKMTEEEIRDIMKLTLGAMSVNVE